MFLARRALAPIEQVTTMAQALSAQDLSQRLALRLPDDEVGRLASTFDAMLARLEDAFARQRQFTSDASHEIRTPLATIKALVEFTLSRERDGDAYRSALTSVNEEVDRLMQMAGTLLTFARAEAGAVPATVESVDLNQLVLSVAEQVQPRALEDGIELDPILGPAVEFTGDETLLAQMLLNLLDNALKHTDRGGRVAIGVEVATDSVKLYVEDNGEGIAEEHLPHVFDRFYRADTARSRAAGGVGLGLSICEWIAQLHGGTIAVSSTPGQLIRFTATFPLGPRSI